MNRKNIRDAISKRFIISCDEIKSTHNYKSDAKLAKHLEIHPQILSDIRTGKAQATTDIISIILTKFPELDGNMIMGKSTTETIGNNLEKIIERIVEETLSRKYKEKAF